MTVKTGTRPQLALQSYLDGLLQEATEAEGELDAAVPSDDFAAAVREEQARDARQQPSIASSTPKPFAEPQPAVLPAVLPVQAPVVAVVEAAVVAEAAKVSMVATRRLQLVAAEADIPVLLLRRWRGRSQDPLGEPSAAWTRWRVASAPSQRLTVAGVGRARWSVELARQRTGGSFSLIVEGCDETGCLAVPAALGHRAAETAGPARHAAA